MNKLTKQKQHKTEHNKIRTQENKNKNKTLNGTVVFVQMKHSVFKHYAICFGVAKMSI